MLLHGGPGLGSDYLDGLVDELDESWAVALPQQRGIAPSPIDGPFDLPTAIADVVGVMDALAWPNAVLVGHSYGGFLALLVATRHPDRCTALLLVDSIGTVGDGGLAAFEAELERRLPERTLARLAELDELPPSPEHLDESLELLWPAYCADPSNPSPYTRIAQSSEAFAGLMPAVVEAMPALAAALPRLRLPLGAVIGAGSPIPRSAAEDVVTRVPGAWLADVPDAGHLPWLERPGCVADALSRLADPA